MKLNRSNSKIHIYFVKWFTIARLIHKIVNARILGRWKVHRHHVAVQSPGRRAGADKRSIAGTHIGPQRKIISSGGWCLEKERDDAQDHPG